MIKRLTKVLVAAVLLASPIVADTAVAQGVTVAPGVRINSTGGTEGYCTLNSVGYDDTGRLVALTAGHCMGEVGAPVYLYGRASDGPVGRYSTHNHDWWVRRPTGPLPERLGWDSSMDYVVVELDAAKVVPANVSPNGVRVDGIGANPAPFRDVVCKDGQTTGVTCGLVIENADNTIRTWQYVWFGDSGGPLVRGSGLVGIVSAINPLTPWGPFQFTNIHGVLADIARQGNVPGVGFEPLK